MAELVVLPGLDATGVLHTEFVARAETRFDAVKVLAYPRDRALDYAELEAWVRERLPERAHFVLLAESFSGPIALAIAAAPPAMLRGLVLSTTFAHAPVPALSVLAPMIAAVPLPVPPIKVLSPLLLGPWSTPRLESQLSDALGKVPASILRYRAALALRADASAFLPRIAMPTVYLRASHDRLLSRACGERILSAVAGAECRVIAGPHLLLQAAPAECARAMERLATLAS